MLRMQAGNWTAAATAIRTTAASANPMASAGSSAPGVNAGTFQKDQRNGCGQKADACAHEVHNGRCARFFGRLHFYILSFLSVYHTFQTFTRALGRKVPSVFPSLRQASVRKGKNFPNGLYNAARLWYHIAMNFTFISGATGGIGKHFPVLCAKNGDNLYLTGRNNDKLLALKAELSRAEPLRHNRSLRLRPRRPCRARQAGRIRGRTGNAVFPHSAGCGSGHSETRLAVYAGKAALPAGASTAKRPWISPSAFCRCAGRSARSSRSAP